MNIRKKQVCSLLSSALIFSSFGFVSGMEDNKNVKQEQDIKQTKFIGKKTNSAKNHEETISVLKFFNAKQVKGSTPQMLPEATPYDKAVVQLLYITNYAMRNICNAQRNFLTTKLHDIKSNCSIKKEYASNLKNNLDSFLESNSNQKYVELWYEGLCDKNCDETLKLKPNLNQDEKDLLSFLIFCEFNISNQKLVDASRNKLAPAVRKLGFETQKMINKAIQNVLRSLAPAKRKKRSEIVDWKDGCVNNIKCEFKIFEDEDSVDKSLGLKEEK